MKNNLFSGMNPMQMFAQLQQLQANPIQFLRSAGLNVPSNLNDPQAIIQHLMNSGQVTQAQFNQAQQIAANFRR